MGCHTYDASGVETRIGDISRWLAPSSISAQRNFLPGLLTEIKSFRRSLQWSHLWNIWILHRIESGVTGSGRISSRTSQTVTAWLFSERIKMFEGTHGNRRGRGVAWKVRCVLILSRRSDVPKSSSILKWKFMRNRGMSSSPTRVWELSKAFCFLTVWDKVREIQEIVHLLLLAIVYYSTHKI